TTSRSLMDSSLVLKWDEMVLQRRKLFYSCPAWGNERLRSRRCRQLWPGTSVQAVAFLLVPRTPAFPDLDPVAGRRDLLARRALYQHEIALPASAGHFLPVRDDAGEVMQHRALRVAQVTARDA